MREFARLWLTQIVWLAVFSICLSSAALQATGLFDVTMHLSTNAANLVTRATAAIGLAAELEMEFHTTLTQWFTVTLIAAGFILPLVPTYGKHSGGSTSLIARCFGPGIPPQVLLPRALLLSLVSLMLSRCRGSGLLCIWCWLCWCCLLCLCCCAGRCFHCRCAGCCCQLTVAFSSSCAFTHTRSLATTLTTTH